MHKPIHTVTEQTDSGPSRSPATNPNAQESRMINLAMKAAEEQLKNGTASSQVIVHFLKLGSIREELEREKLRNETSLLNAKKKDIESSSHNDKLLEKALEAMTTYSPSSNDKLDEQDIVGDPDADP